MSISSVSAPAAAKTPDLAASKPAGENHKGNPSDEVRARAEQVPQRAALPPGQGTRIDVLI